MNEMISDGFSRFDDELFEFVLVDEAFGEDDLRRRKRLEVVQVAVKITKDGAERNKYKYNDRNVGFRSKDMDKVC